MLSRMNSKSIVLLLAVAVLWTVGGIGITLGIVFGSLYLDAKIVPFMAFPMLGMMWATLSILKKA